LGPTSSEQIEIQPLNRIYNFPNPFNPDTQIVFTLSRADQVNIKIYNAKGQLCHNLCNQYYSQGSHSVQFQSDSLPSGIYFYQMKTGQQTITKKMMIMK